MTYDASDARPGGDAISRGVDQRSVDRTLLPLLENPFEELWIIVDDGQRNAATLSSRELVRPTSGNDRASEIVVQTPDDPYEFVRLPLASSDWLGRVDGPILSATVRQRFVNPFPHSIDAMHYFALPHDCAIHDLIMRVGDRTIRAVIRERTAAARLFQAARRAGHPSVSLFEARPNVFPTRITNLAAGAAIEVEIALHGLAAYDDGWHELALPLATAPKSTPGGFAPPPSTPQTPGILSRSDTASAEAADRDDLSHLELGERSTHRVSMHWTIDAGAPLGDVASPTHRITTERQDTRRATVTLADGTIGANRDFVLRWRTVDATKVHAGRDSVVAASLVSAGDRFVLTLLPKSEFDSPTAAPPGTPPGTPPATPIELLIAIDRSRPMEGAQLRQAKAVAKRLLDRLGPDDSFALVELPGGIAIDIGPATRERVAQARRRVDRVRAIGPSDMAPALVEALNHPRDPGRTRHAVVISSFQVGNEAIVLAETMRAIGTARLSSVGVGVATHRFLASALPLVGHGVAAVMLPGSSAHRIADGLLDVLRKPVLAGPILDAGTIAFDDVLPLSLPDLRAGHPVTIIGRATHRGAATLMLRGRAGAEELEIPLVVDFDGRADAEALDRLWARAMIAEYTRRAWAGELPDARQRIGELSLRHGLLSPFTGLFVVDASTTVSDRHADSVGRVPMPPDQDHAATDLPPSIVR